MSRFESLECSADDRLSDRLEYVELHVFQEG
jgi:hypothetical protein